MRVVKSRRMRWAGHVARMGEGMTANGCINGFQNFYRGADKSLARPTSRCILFDGENISFDASLVIYIHK
jgi:hypothetical protein